ncbi:hypothetical protein O9929_26650 [Vibrio lentus]|nr:hypothetical protein [Vibrio lentus]
MGLPPTAVILASTQTYTRFAKAKASRSDHQLNGIELEDNPLIEPCGR